MNMLNFQELDKFRIRAEIGNWIFPKKKGGPGDRLA